MTVRSIVWAVVISGCGSSLPPPCDAATAVKMEIECFARVQSECVEADIPEDKCVVIQQCEHEADARQDRCKP